MASDRTVAQLRAFNRFITRFARALERRYLDTDFTLLEARLLWEVHATPGETALKLQERLGIDGGQMSRLVARLEKSGHIERPRAKDDARRRPIRLTKLGQEAFAELDRRADAQSRQFLDRLDEAQQTSLAASLEQVATLMGQEPGPIAYRHGQPGDLGWMLQRHAEIYTTEFAYEPIFERYVAESIPPFLANFDPRTDRIFVAERAGLRLGMAAIQHDPDRPRWAKLRWYFVEAMARGQGIGTELLAQALHFVMDVDYDGVSLWTCSDLHAARRQYEELGFALVEEAPCPWKDDIVQQKWDLAF